MESKEEHFECELDGNKCILNNKTFFLDQFISFSICVKSIKKTVHLRDFNFLLKESQSITSKIDHDYYSTIIFKPRFKVIINDRLKVIDLSHEETKEFYDWVERCSQDTADRRDDLLDDLLDD